MKNISKVLLILLLSISCTSPTEKPETIHNFQLRLDLSQLPVSVASIRGQLTNSNSDLIIFDFDFDTISHTATATVSEIPVGEWNLTVNALDENEIVTHSASTIVLIHVGLNTVNLVFEAETGSLQINIGLESIQLPAADSIITYMYQWDDQTEDGDFLGRINYDSIFQILSPNTNLDSNLLIQLKTKKYVTKVGMTRYTIFSNDSDFTYTWNIININKALKSFHSDNFLAAPWLDFYDSCESSVFIVYKEDPESTTTYAVETFLLWQNIDYPYKRSKSSEITRHNRLKTIIKNEIKKSSVINPGI